MHRRPAIPILCFAMLGCDQVFYYPDRLQRGTPEDCGLAYEDVFFSAKDGPRLHAWFLPASRGPTRGTVLHAHGNAANITGHYEFVRWLPEAGYNVLTFDYRGYGRSEGRVSREGTIDDTLAALDYLRGRPEVDASRIVVFGQSIGACVAIIVCSQRKGQVAGLAIDSAFTGYREIARHHVQHQPLLLALGWWFPWTIPVGFDPIEAIGSVAPVPLLVMHGKQDRIVPWRMGERLYQAARGPKQWWLIEDTDHMEVWLVHPEEAERRMLQFLNSALTVGDDR